MTGHSRLCSLFSSTSQKHSHYNYVILTKWHNNCCRYSFIMVCCVRCSKGCKIWCGSAILVVILLVTVMVVLFFTVFKPKDPDIILQSVKLERFKLEFPTLGLNISLGVVVTVENHNHGSFTYQNSTAYVYHRGTLVAEAPLHEDTIPSRHDHNITMSFSTFADFNKLTDLFTDYSTGVINFTSTVSLFGKVDVLNLFKMKASSYNACSFSLFVNHQTINSYCNFQFKLWSFFLKFSVILLFDLFYYICSVYHSNAFILFVIY